MAGFLEVPLSDKGPHSVAVSGKITCGTSTVRSLRSDAQSRRVSAISSATETDDNDDVEETEPEDSMVTSSSVVTPAYGPRRAIRKRIHHLTASGSSHRPWNACDRNYVNSSNHSMAPTVLEAEKPLSAKIQTFKTRTLWTLILVLMFLVILAAGHFYASVLVLVLTVLLYREIIALKRNIEKDKKLPLFFVLRWYWFLLTIYGTGYSWILPLAEGFGIPQYHCLKVAVTHHFIITYVYAFLGLILFIMSLRRFSLRYQFSQFALLVLTCVFVVGQSMFQIANIYDGLIWFFVSSSSVIVNDCFAYIFGIFFGRTRLLRLSPKKTVEGFLGASVVTLLWSILLGYYLSQYSVFTCPQQSITFRPFAMWTELACDPHPVFKERQLPLWNTLASLIGFSTVSVKPALWHCFVLGVFAAFFAPFGGFFASALKRALRVKDFGTSIPGHGGITDRFDCQLIMGMFTFLYVRTWVVVIMMIIGMTVCMLEFEAPDAAIGRPMRPPVGFTRRVSLLLFPALRFVFRNVRHPSLTTIAQLIESLSSEDKAKLLALLNSTRFNGLPA